MSWIWRVAALAPIGVAAPAVAGPPYLTDDPVPTDTGHWELYAFTVDEGHGSAFDGTQVSISITAPLKAFS